MGHSLIFWQIQRCKGNQKVITCKFLLQKTPVPRLLPVAGGSKSALAGPLVPVVDEIIRRQHDQQQKIGDRARQNGPDQDIQHAGGRGDQQPLPLRRTVQD